MGDVGRSPRKKASDVDDSIETLSATGIDNALAALSVASKGEAAAAVAAGAEAKGRKAAYLEFEDTQLPIMREEMPGLKLAQYKDKIFKLWQKSPQNPANKAP